MPPRRPPALDEADSATELLPPIDEHDYDLPMREPELLTHRQHNHGGGPDPAAQSRINAMVASSGIDPVDSDGEFHQAGLDAEEGDTWRRWLRPRNLILAFVSFFFIIPAIVFGIMYMFVEVPSPHEVAASQAKTVTYYYADGSVMGQDFQDGNRVILEPDQIPDTVKHAVYAAEDASFETNAGFDVTGIVRAVWKQVSGGAGGGSTITQQYIKKATENEERTITRKATEIVKAFKMNNELSKSEIITAYLNTIYFGRGAYGIQAASQAYFKKDIEKVSPSEAAFLAGVIQAPSRGDNKEYAQQRWSYVIDQMAKHKWLTAREFAEAKLPKLASAESAKLKGFTGPKRHIKDRVVQELERLGYPESQVRAAGYKVYTTVDRRAQRLAEQTVKDVMKGEPKQLQEALVAVNPKTGGIKAYYGGPYDQSSFTDWANTTRNPGSSFKPFDFVALLKMDKGPGEMYDGSDNRTFPGREKPLHNAGPGSSCPGMCTVARAMEISANTAFYDMVLNDTTPQAVAEAAYEAGIPETRGDKATLPSSDPNISIGAGNAVVTPREMAAAYATFAADGMRRDSHFVYKVTTPDDEIIHQAKDEPKPAFDPDREKSKQLAGNVTKVLEPVLPHSNRVCAGGRDCAGKTGTHESHVAGENAQAWMVGYTPSLSAAAWVGTGGSAPIKNMNGGQIFGSGLPGAIWVRFMDAYYQGKPNEPFPDVEVIGKDVPPPPPPVTEAPPETSKGKPSKEKPTKEKPTDNPTLPPSSTSKEPGRPEPTEGTPQPPDDPFPGGDDEPSE